MRRPPRHFPSQRGCSKQAGGVVLKVGEACPKDGGRGIARIDYRDVAAGAYQPDVVVVEGTQG